MINVKALTIDRTVQTQVDEFNKLLKNYRELLFMAGPNVPRDKNGNIINMDKQIESFRNTVSKKDFKLEVGKAITEEFENIDLKNLIKKPPPKKKKK